MLLGHDPEEEGSDTWHCRTGSTLEILTASGGRQNLSTCGPLGTASRRSRFKVQSYLLSTGAVTFLFLTEHLHWRTRDLFLLAIGVQVLTLVEQTLLHTGNSDLAQQGVAYHQLLVSLLSLEFVDTCVMVMSVMYLYCRRLSDCVESGGDYSRFCFYCHCVLALSAVF